MKKAPVLLALSVVVAAAVAAMVIVSGRDHGSKHRTDGGSGP